MAAPSGETARSLVGLSYLPNRNYPFMEKSLDIFLWVVLPLVLIFPIAVYAKTTRFATELSRMCDPCTGMHFEHNYRAGGCIPY